jgi:hypothetical protein
VPLQKFDSTTFKNVAEEALVYLDDAPQEWANSKDCGTFTCTGPANVLMSFEQSKFVSTDGTSLPFFFTSGNPISHQISSKNQALTSSYLTTAGGEPCTFMFEWNAWHCSKTNHAILLFESTDDDRYSRLSSPVFVNSDLIGYSN